MPLFLNGIEYRPELGDLCQFVRDLPAPEYNTYQQCNYKLPLVTCRQREYVVKGEHSSIRYLGTGRVETCVVIFVQNEFGESLLAHSDIGPRIPVKEQFDWVEIFSRFSAASKEFKIMIFGGIDPRLSHYAQVKLTDLLTSIYQFSLLTSKKMNIHRADILKLEYPDHRLKNFMIDCQTLDVIVLLDFLTFPNVQEEEREFKLYDMKRLKLYEAYNDTQGQVTKQKLTFSPTMITLIKDISSLTDAEIHARLYNDFGLNGALPFQLKFLRKMATSLLDQGIEQFEESTSINQPDKLLVFTKDALQPPKPEVKQHAQINNKVDLKL